MAKETQKKTQEIQITSDVEGTRHQRRLDQIKEFHERLALLQRAYDALSERLSDQRLAIAESWEEREKEWGEKLRLSEAERETLTADLARAISDAAARSEALTESERRVAELLDEDASLRAQFAAESERRQEAEKGLRRAVVDFERRRSELEERLGNAEQNGLLAERRAAKLLDEAARLRAQFAAESSRRRAAEDASRSAGAAKEDAARRAEAAETEMRRISEEAAALRAELEQLRPDHEQLAKFHGMVLAEVDALLNDKQVLVSRLAEVEAERDAARQNAERVSAAQAAQLAQVRAEYDVLHSEFVRFTNLRLFTYTAPLRATYAALRRILGLKSG